MCILYQWMSTFEHKIPRYEPLIIAELLVKKDTWSLNRTHISTFWTISKLTSGYRKKSIYGIIEHLHAYMHLKYKKCVFIEFKDSVRNLRIFKFLKILQQLYPQYYPSKSTVFTLKDCTEYARIKLSNNFYNPWKDREFCLD